MTSPPETPTDAPSPSPSQTPSPSPSPEPRWREALALIVLLLAVAGLFALPSLAPKPVGVATLGSPPPPVEVVKTWLNLPPGPRPAWSAAEGVDFSALKGKVVILEFWSAWCHQCRGANLELNALHEEGRADLQVIGVTMRDRYVEEPAILAHVRDEIRFPVALLSKGRAITSYQVHEIPHSVLVSREGTICWQGKGGTAAFREALKAELDKK